MNPTRSRSFVRRAFNCICHATAAEPADEREFEPPRRLNKRQVSLLDRPRLRTFVQRLVTAPTDIASLALFRILFGLLMAFAMTRFLVKGWVTLYYVTPKFFFHYPGLAWIHPWPTFWMHAHFVLLTVCALGIALGLFYRACSLLFFLGFAYVELIDQTAYLNHYYFITLLSGLMTILPAHRAWSLDAWRRPALLAQSVPAWCLNLLRFQIAIVYIFAGVAKFNPDWLLRAEPLRIWLAARSDLPLVGPWLSQLWVAYAASWFGAIFDTGIVFLLLCKSTRKAAYALVIFFHLATWMFFHIGMFPWIMMTGATLLFPADWPRHLAASLLRKSRPVSSAERTVLVSANTSVLSPGMALALGLYVTTQLALPLRSYFQSQPPAWTRAGFICSWRVMIAEKSGYVEFYAHDPATGESWRLPIEHLLTPRQQTLMAKNPYLIREMARHLAADLRTAGYTHAEVRVNAFATLDGRPSQRLINPNVNLAAATGSGWIVPLTN